MGITSLLQELKSISNNVRVKDLPKNARIAIDAHCWLHRGSYSCAREIVRNIPTTKYVDFFMNMIQILIDNGISSAKILVVFDGCPLPIKKITNQERDISRKKNIELALQAELRGDINLADNYYRQSIHITPNMVKSVINELKRRDIAYMVSPYESDAQLTFLATHGFVDYVITEDSDLIVYGCPHILFKLDRTGHCVALHRSDLGRNMNMSFLNWTDKQFKLFCCLTGCDYLKNIRNIGIKKAYKLVAKCKTLPMVAQELRKTMMVKNTNGSNNYEAYSLDKDDMNIYLHTLEKAIATFTYQVVYNPCTLELQHLSSPFPPVSELFTLTHSASRTHSGACTGTCTANTINTTTTDFLGVLYDNDIATLLAKGDITAQQLVCVVDENSGALHMELMEETVQASPPLSALAHQSQQQQQPVYDDKYEEDESVVSFETERIKIHAYNNNNNNINNNASSSNNKENNPFFCNSSSSNSNQSDLYNDSNDGNNESNNDNNQDIWAFESSKNNNNDKQGTFINTSSISSTTHKRGRRGSSDNIGSMLHPLPATEAVVTHSESTVLYGSNGNSTDNNNNASVIAVVSDEFETLYRRKRKLLILQQQHDYQQSPLQPQPPYSDDEVNNLNTNNNNGSSNSDYINSNNNIHNDDDDEGEYFQQFEFRNNDHHNNNYNNYISYHDRHQVNAAGTEDDAGHDNDDDDWPVLPRVIPLLNNTTNCFHQCIPVNSSNSNRQERNHFNIGLHDDDDDDDGDDDILFPVFTSKPTYGDSTDYRQHHRQHKQQQQQILQPLWSTGGDFNNNRHY